MALRHGTTLGPYSVTAKIGEGGMGEVYQARDAQFGSRVLVKTLTLVLAVTVSMVGVAVAQQRAFDRLPMDELNVVPVGCH